MLRESIAAVVVTYHPEMSLCQRLIPLIPQVQKVVVIDNTENPGPNDILSELESQGCHVIRNESNPGIGRALNQGVVWAISKGYSWILTLDQDTHVSDGLISLYRDALRSPLAKENVGILSTAYTDIHSKTVDGLVFEQTKVARWKNVNFLISSGSFFSVETYEKAGGFREEFFLDWVDHDFCIKVRRIGLKNFIYTKPMFQHALGNKSRHRIPGLGVTFTTNNHPAWRCYLIAYNLTILIKENFFSEFFLSVFYITYLLRKFMLVLCFEQDKKNKIFLLGRGLRNAIFNIQNTSHGQTG